MDGIDFAICISLIMNSRVPYRQLAEKFNMSVNSIHKRIKNLVKLGVIERFFTQFSGLVHSFTSMVMFGTSNAIDVEEILPNLGNHECIYNVTQASSNLIYLHARIRSINELESLVSFVKQVGEVDKPNIGLIPELPDGAGPAIEETGGSGDRGLSNLDFLIVNSLKDNSRKLITEVAQEVRASTKTVKRRLTRLIEKNLVHFSIDWYPDKSNDILSIFILKLNPHLNLDKMNLMRTLRKQYGQNLAFSWVFSNLPNLMLVCFWTNTMKELQRIESSIKSEKFESVTATILLRGANYPTWQDKYLEAKIKEINANSN
ncbi:MAG: Lrp/AsnC family transcriptional regulator [Candidatus Helarchaeota archaeon]|nr:Lrp/AsnC family transcriptional regulator [Candidatus Helarchaeota archaeon]